VLVTSPPTKIKASVDAASRSDRRWRQGAKGERPGEPPHGVGGEFERHPAGDGVNGREA